MAATAWLAYLALALFLGVCGQLVRVAIGLKKLKEKSLASGTQSQFDAQKFWVSIALGAMAGLITAIVKWKEAELALQPDFIFTIMAAGYAGSDIIEGLIDRLPKSSASGS